MLNLWTPTQQKWVCIIGALASLYFGYVSACVLVEPPVLRIAKLTTIQNFYSSDKDRFVRKLRERFPAGTPKDEFLQALRESGFTANEKAPVMEGSDARVRGTVIMKSGITSTMSIADFEVAVSGDFKDNKLVRVAGLITILTP